MSLARRSSRASRATRRTSATSASLRTLPARCSVLFASAYDGWAFGIGYFAAYYAKNFEMPQGSWRQGLWGEYYYLHGKTKKTRSTPWMSNNQPMFVTFVLEPLMAIYKAMEEPTEHNPDALPPLRQLTKKDRRLALQCVMRKWLPLATSVLKMATRMLPSPVTAQKSRAEHLCVVNPAFPDQLPTLAAIQGTFMNAVHLQDALGRGDQPLGLCDERDAAGHDNRGAEAYVAVARVFSGTFRPNAPTYPRLYMVMGSDFVRVEHVAAGNIVGILGLHEHVLKTATLLSTLACPSLARMPYQAKPIVRVAVEPADPRHFAELEACLQRLYRSDSTVEVHVLETGKHVLVALGELHLERCVKDLTERFAKVPLHVSEPLVGFRETIVANETGARPCTLLDLKLAEMTTSTTPDGKHKTLVCPTPDGQVAVHLRAVPLPSTDLDVLEAHAEGWKRFHSNDDDADVATYAADGAPSCPRKKTCGDAFWTTMDLDLLRSCGPRRVGPNLLINNVPNWMAPSTIWVLNRGLVTDERMKLESLLVSGFQLATAAGPLCDEPAWMVAFIVDDIVLTPVDDGAEAAYGPLSGLVISGMKSRCRSAFVHAPVRLVKAMYKCTVQCQSEQLGKLYSVFAKRQACVVGEELSDGSALYSVELWLCDRATTSGNASNPQLLFDHWAVMPDDPFFQPTKDEEREDFGEAIAEHNAVWKLLEGVRQRKGLSREEKIVAKQNSTIEILGAPDKIKGARLARGKAYARPPHARARGL
ncbi:hypothetical protein SDRG_02387 [Saprolegnia diclina VS20]|uniref:Uncharacterized protein n=1 Tax=Saprolegnia diclina (strain VS20) TaxID=1156394 RepID=T0R0N9_SAPDV|nr:hypothetical protein SDRG_02387 [Saprolegnia diclina VS20]EQC40496.1 hypothetical protein SDRG_02387 [Saprolegnia diclina VS20]|eukprot:XP_008606195.1 hypothetical protein SDRG_02387 [Saprolegnia diclina VS20]